MYKENLGFALGPRVLMSNEVSLTFASFEFHRRIIRHTHTPTPTPTHTHPPIQYIIIAAARALSRPQSHTRGRSIRRLHPRGIVLVQHMNLTR